MSSIEIARPIVPLAEIDPIWLPIVPAQRLSRVTALLHNELPSSPAVLIDPAYERGRHRFSAKLPKSRRGSRGWSGYHGSGRSRRGECEECSRGNIKEHACRRNMLSALSLPLSWRKTKTI